MDQVFDVNAGFVSSWHGIMSVFLLASGGGVFGIIAREGLQSSSGTIEFLFWISIFAWVTTLLGFCYGAYNSRPLSTKGLVQHTVTIAVLYVLATVLYGIYDAFENNDDELTLFVFALDVATSVGYVIKAIFHIIQLIKENERKNYPDAQNAVHVDLPDPPQV